MTLIMTKIFFCSFTQQQPCRLYKPTDEWEYKPNTATFRVYSDHIEKQNFRD